MSESQMVGSSTFFLTRSHGSSEIVVVLPCSRSSFHVCKLTAGHGFTCGPSLGKWQSCLDQDTQLTFQCRGFGSSEVLGCLRSFFCKNVLSGAWSVGALLQEDQATLTK